MSETKQTQITASLEQPQRIDAYLAKNTDFSRSYLQKLIEKQQIQVNGKIIKSSYQVQNNDLIEFWEEPCSAAPFCQPEQISLDIVYEDDDLLLVNKPAGLVVHPGAGNREHTLVNALLYRFPQLADLTTCRFGLVHRLDKFTEGLMLVAKNSLAHQALSKQFEARTVVKKYYAIANANVSKDEFVLDAPIGRDPNNRQKYKVITEGRSKSRSALTLVKVLHRKPGKTLLEVQIKTGRTHQIRVHLFQAGFPVLGDPVYAQKKLQGNGQLLQAFYLGFTHPTTNQPMQFELPLAPRLARVITVPIAATVLP